jgi:hypothetical protein
MSVPTGCTGGMVYYYRVFDPGALHTDLYATISGDYFWDTSVRVRATVGAKLMTATGNLKIRERTVFLPVLSIRNSIAFALKVEGLTDRLVLQCGTLFTTGNGKRVIRVMTIAVPVVNNLEMLRSSVDEGALVAFMVKRTRSMLNSQGVPDAAAHVKRQIKELTEKGFRFSSLYHLVHSLIESRLLRPLSSEGPDGRLVALVNARMFSIVDSLLFLYPRMFAIDTGVGPLPLVPVSFRQGHVIVVHTIDQLFVWVSPETPLETVRAFFGGDTVPSEITATGSEESTKLAALIADCCTMSARYLPTEVIQVGSPREAVFREILLDAVEPSHRSLQAFLTETGAAFR